MKLDENWMIVVNVAVVGGLILSLLLGLKDCESKRLENREQTFRVCVQAGRSPTECKVSQP